MWVYNVNKRTLYYNGNAIAKGYSGYGTWKNKSKYENIKNKGPIPRGKYTIGKPFDSNKTGPFVLALKPRVHSALGRTNFQIHGDSRSNPGNASTDCIILSREIRKKIATSNDDILKVE